MQQLNFQEINQVGGGMNMNAPYDGPDPDAWFWTPSEAKGAIDCSVRHP
jgi:hypothetical protein